MFYSKGQSLIEIVLVTVLFAILSLGVLTALLSSSFATHIASQDVIASAYVQEGIEAVRSIRDRDWTELTNGTHGLTTSAGFYDFSATSETLDNGFIRTITIETVYRSGGLTGNISASGTEDDNTKRVTVNVRWSSASGEIQQVDGVIYLTNWTESVWIEDEEESLREGSFNSTDISSNGNGEIVLRESFFDWSNLETVHEVDLAGNGDRIAMWLDEVNDILYILSTNTTGNELNAIDVSNVSDATPPILSGLELNGMTASDLAYFDGYLYVSSSDNNQEVIVVDALTMIIVNMIDIPGSADANAVATIGNTLVVGRSSSGGREIYFYDISAPTGLISELDNINLNDTITDIALSATHAFFATDDEEIVVVRLSDYTIVNTLELDDTEPTSLVLVGTHLYVGGDDGTNNFIELDVSNPEGTIFILNQLAVTGDIFGLDVDSTETYAVLGVDENDSEVRIIDLDTFTESSNVNLSSNSNALSVVVFGSIAYVGTTDDSTDFAILQTNILGWNATSRMGQADVLNTQNPLAVTENAGFTYIATEQDDNQDELFIYDTSVPSSPVYLGSLNLDASVYDLVFSSEYLYLATNSDSRELDIINVTNKVHPVHVGSYDAAGSANARTVAVSGSTAYLGREQSSDAEFFVIGVSSPSLPTLLGSMQTTGSLRSSVMDGTNVFASTTDDAKELLMIDVSNPSAPSERSSYNLSGAYDGLSVALSANTLVLGRQAGAQELAVFDISNPSSPSLSSQTTIGGTVFGVSMDGTQTTYLATNETDNEFQRWDLSDPSVLIEDTAFDLDAIAVDVIFAGVYAHMVTAHDTMELQIIGEATASMQYAREGSYTSTAFDAGSAVSWETISWIESGQGTIELRIRTADTEANLENAIWVGSDGTQTTSYTVSGSSVVADPGASGTEWIQWKAFLSGDGFSTPVLEQVTLEYE